MIIVSRIKIFIFAFGCFGFCLCFSIIVFGEPPEDYTSEENGFFWYEDYGAIGHMKIEKFHIFRSEDEYQRNNYNLTTFCRNGMDVVHKVDDITCVPNYWEFWPLFPFDSEFVGQFETDRQWCDTWGIGLYIDNYNHDRVIDEVTHPDPIESEDDFTAWTYYALLTVNQIHNLEDYDPVTVVIVDDIDISGDDIGGKTYCNLRLIFLERDDEISLMHEYGHVCDAYSDAPESNVGRYQWASDNSAGDLAPGLPSANYFHYGEDPNKGGPGPQRYNNFNLMHYQEGDGEDGDIEYKFEKFPWISAYNYYRECYNY